MTEDYEQVRQSFKPDEVRWLFVAESPPPADAGKISTRHFYRSDTGPGDRLFMNTMRALYPEAAKLSEEALAAAKAEWLKRFQTDGCYMIEAVPESIPHGVPKPKRREAIKTALPNLLERVKALAGPETKLILIKSNTYDIAAEPLRQAGFKVLNDALLDYPGAWREEPYRRKLTTMMKTNGWK